MYWKHNYTLNLFSQLTEYINPPAPVMSLTKNDHLNFHPIIYKYISLNVQQVH